MPSMVSYPRRLQSGQITCYLNRTYHVLTTCKIFHLDNFSFFAKNACVLPQEPQARVCADCCILEFLAVKTPGPENK